ncbi:3-isopropylmalate dehydratase [Pseudonocardia sp. MH-G8]|nr:3-isopropylmalate dehydratase [Pseudonocardia sp. MH-G8]
MFGNEINTDDMYPGFAMKLPIAEGARHMFHATRPDWPQLVRPGDIVVGGRNFGLGSSRPVALLFQELGVRCLLAEEFNSLFLRNCINYGLAALTVPGITGQVTDGDTVDVDVAAGTVRDRRTGQELQSPPIPEFLLRILRSGGLIAQLERDGHLTTSTERSA